MTRKIESQESRETIPAREEKPTSQTTAVKKEKKEGLLFTLFAKIEEKLKKIREASKENEIEELAAQESRVLFSEKILKNPGARTLYRLLNLMTIYFIACSPVDYYKICQEQEAFLLFIQESTSTQLTLSQDEQDRMKMPIEKLADIFSETKDIFHQVLANELLSEEKKKREKINL